VRSAQLEQIITRVVTMRAAGLQRGRAFLSAGPGGGARQLEPGELVAYEAGYLAALNDVLSLLHEAQQGRPL
jgi:hypothetical protein